MARTLRSADVDNFDGTRVPGYYQRTSLNDIINNFIVAYIGNDKVLQNVNRHEVAFWAQRVVQEFSYDVLHSEKSVELELNEARIVQLPNDYVNYRKITRADENGIQRTVLPAQDLNATRAALQDYKHEYIYDSDGDQVYADESETTKRFQNPGVTREDALNYYDGYFFDEDYSYYYRSYYGKRYGIDPRRYNFNGEYLLDNTTGLIYFDQTFNVDTLVTLFYISDGLADNGDLSNVYVPKLAEDAVYANILYNLSKLRPAASGAAGLYKKEAMAKLRNTKIRLSNMKLEEITQVFRGKSKWIKH